MTDEDQSQKIIVDSDWKEQAQQEKKQLDEKLEKTKPQELPQASFAEIINLLVMQATVGLAGYRAPTGETLPPDLGMAKHFIDLLEVLQEKTKSTLEPDEEKFLQTVLYELRLRYVEMSDAVAAAIKEHATKGSAPTPQQPTK